MEDSPVVGVNQTTMIADPAVPHCNESASIDAMNIRDHMRNVQALGRMGMYLLCWALSRGRSGVPDSEASDASE